MAREDVAGVRYTDIVVGVDGSPSAGAALRWAVEQARRTGARVRAVTAWEVPFYAEWMPMIPFEDLATGAEKVLAESVGEACGIEERDVEVGESVVPGHAAQVLVDESASAALLVVGHRGHRGFAGALLGSVSLHCAQHAHCPVVVVRGADDPRQHRHL
jgi:nucleotide-binding universal stress UspA family protein